jgi:hypothetical protein
MDPLLLMTSGDSPKHHIIHQRTNATELKGLGVHMKFMGTFAHHAATMWIKFAAASCNTVAPRRGTHSALGKRAKTELTQ